MSSAGRSRAAVTPRSAGRDRAGDRGLDRGQPGAPAQEPRRIHHWQDAEAAVKAAVMVEDVARTVLLCAAAWPAG